MSASLSSRALSATAAVIAACMVLVTAAPALATFPGANGKIAFGKDGKISALDPVSGAVSDLGKSFANADSPSWSADGKKIAFTNGDGIAIARVGSSGARTIVRSGAPLVAGPSDVLGQPVGVGGDVTFAPNGRQLAFTCSVAFPEDPGGYNGICAINLDGSALAMVVSISYMNVPPSGPAWSPDGGTVAFDLFERWGGGWGISTIAMTATPLVSFSIGQTWYLDVADASWAPDSSRIAFTGSTALEESAGTIDSLSDEVWTMATDGTNGSDLQQLTNDLTTERGAAWSPDGTQIAFIRDDGTTPGIYSVPATGGTPQLLYAGQGFTKIDWQPLPPRSRR